MKDKKFIISVLIIVVLALVLSYVTLIGPKIDGYFTKKKADAQLEIVQVILQAIDQQGYVALGDGGSSVVLVKYQPPQQDPQLNQEQLADTNTQNTIEEQ